MTMAIVAANVCAWVFLQGLGTPEPLQASVCNYGLIPAELFGAATARAEDSAAMICSVAGSPLSWLDVLTSMFMHGSWMHIIGNMWFFWIFGDNVEDSMGHVRFVIFYLLCGAAAAAAQIAEGPHSVVPMVGASGAIGGVMGAYAVAYPKAKVRTLLILGWFIRLVDVPAFVMLGIWFVLQLASGAMMPPGQGGVAFWAHVGGFVAGAVLFFLFRTNGSQRKQRPDPHAVH